jgi:23S rRNA G2445 N2-methylase RlmL
LEHAPAFSADHQAAAMQLREAAQAAICAAPAPIIGRDRDADAIAAARANIAAAGLEDVIALELGAVSSAQPPHAAAAPGFIVTNPPWGLRLGDEAALRDLYAALGRVARERFFDWGLTLITPSAKLASAADRRLKRLIELRQGGVNLGLWGTPGE